MSTRTEPIVTCAFDPYPHPRAAECIDPTPWQPKDAPQPAPDAEPPMPAHVLEFIDEELKARNWTRRDLAERMGGDAGRNELSLEILDLRDPHVLLGDESAAAIGRAFGTGAEIWINLDNTWRTAARARIQEHATELYTALRMIFFSYEDDCDCECDTDTCCKKVKERCAKCEARAALELIESPYAGEFDATLASTQEKQ